MAGGPLGTELLLTLIFSEVLVSVMDVQQRGCAGGEHSCPDVLHSPESCNEPRHAIQQ